MMEKVIAVDPTSPEAAQAKAVIEQLKKIGMAVASSRARFRFTFILFLAALGTALAAVGGWRYARASAPVSGPIIVISIDTLRADHLPAYGYTKVQHAGHRRARGRRRRLRARLLARAADAAGARVDPVGPAAVRDRRARQRRLHGQGRRAAAAADAARPRLHDRRRRLGLRAAQGNRHRQGFDFFDGEMPPSSRASFDRPGAARRRRVGGDRRALARHRSASSRAFLFLHLYEPHKPYAPPERFAEYAPYDGEIAYTDEIVGRLVRYLKSHQLYDRSTIVLLSDHGEGLGDHGEQEHGLFLYDEAIHVPLIIKQESNAGAGRRVADLVQHIDLVPTILDLVKAPVPGGFRGRSLKPVLDGTGRLPDTSVYSEALYARYHFGWSELTALTDDRYRYIRAPRDELYDLQRDADERDEHRRRAAAGAQALRGALDAICRRRDDPGAGRGLRRGARAAAGARLRRRADRRVDATRRRDAARSEGQARDSRDATARRSTSPASGNGAQAIALLQQILRDDPEMADVWSQLAVFATRHRSATT